MKNKELIYGMYCRKSSESEDKQMQSIDSQIRDLEVLSKKENIFVNKNYTICESQSAHTLGRDGFKRLTDAINQEKINCILTWHINRLSRNPVDGAHIIHLLDLGKLHCIKTTEKTYYNTPDDKFMLNLAFGMSKKDSDDKSILVKRGLREKAIKGYPSGVSKIGYLNDKTEDRGNRKWIKDEIRFPLVQMLFQRYLTGKYSVADIHRYAVDELRLTTPIRKKEGGRLVAQSYVYSMLADPIYAGFFNYQDKRYELNPNLERVISEDEYYKIQIMLGQKGKPRMRTSEREGLYNYIMKDAQGGSVTPDFKFQLICDCKQKFSYTTKSNCPNCGIKISKIKNPTYLSYVYYSSSKDRKKRGVKVKCIEEKKVDQIILEKFTNEIAISQELSDWCVRHLRLIDSKLKEDTKNIEVSQVETEENITKQLERLLDLKTSRDNINAEELKIISTKEEKLYKELESIKNTKKANNGSYNLEHTEKRFNLMSKILQTLENGSRNERKDILLDFGSNLTLYDGKVSICNVKEVEVFINCLEKAKLINPRFEPKNTLADKEKTDVFTSVIPTLLRG